jgi:hypothetical protein
MESVTQGVTEDMAQAPSRERERILEASTDIFGGGIE